MMRPLRLSVPDSSSLSLGCWSQQMWVHPETLQLPSCRCVQHCIALLSDSPPLITTTAVMLHGHADAYIVSVRGRRSISVCVVSRSGDCRPIRCSYIERLTSLCSYVTNLFLDFCIYRHVTQSTRHKGAHNKAISRHFFYLHAGQVAPRNSAQHGGHNYTKRAYNDIRNAVQFGLVIWV